MTSAPKITLIGAGSTVFTRNLLGDILAYPELAQAHIALHDIVDSDWHAASRCCVSRVWARWKARLPHDECIASVATGAPTWGGIGVLRPPVGKLPG